MPGGPQSGYPTDYLEQAIAEHFFSISTFTPPDWYLGVAVYDSGAGYTTGWGETGSAGGGTIEPDAYGDTNYARIHVASTDFSIIGSGGYLTSSFLEPTYGFLYVTPTVPLAFPEPSLPWGDGAPRYMAWFDAPTGGNVLAYHDVNVGSTGSPIPQPGVQLTTIAQSLYLSFPAGSWDWDTVANPNGYNSPFPVNGAYLCLGVVDALLDHIFHKVTYTPPSPLYLGCRSSNPVVADEPDQLPGFFYPPDPAYARISCGGNWASSLDGATGKRKITNTAAFTFAACSVNTAWQPGDYFLAAGGTSGVGDKVASIPSQGAIPTMNNGDQLRAPAGTLNLLFG